MHNGARTPKTAILAKQKALWTCICLSGKLYAKNLPKITKKKNLKILKLPVTFVFFAVKD